MKYYSDVLKTVFDTEKELVKAEQEHADRVKAEAAAKKAKDEKRKTAAEAIDKLAADYKAKQKEARVALEAYNKAIAKFCEEYGSYHYSIHYDDISDLINEIVARW